MLFSKRLQIMILLLGDFVLFYASLFFTLALRYGLKFPFAPPETDLSFFQILDTHKWPFFYVNLLWILIFYINGLYDIKSFPSPKKVLSKVLETMSISGILAGLIFYLVPSFEITPKTNLLIDIILVTSLMMLWRRFFWLFTSKISKIKVLLFGNSKEVEDLANFLNKNIQLGYEPVIMSGAVVSNLIDIITKNKIQIIVASQNIMEDDNAVKRFYKALPLGVSTVDFPTFYETVTEKIPVSVINESWFLVNLVEINKRSFESFKRFFDLVLSIILGIPTLILFPFIAVLSKIESQDKILVRQRRIGKNGKPFTLIKFRSMYNISEIDGKAKWADEKDERITKIGKILRKTRLDELPQIWNVLKGDMSFIGPRPERSEFVEKLQKQIPHYAMRHLIKPGLTGWAQIKFPYGASVEQAMEKLQYDLYYIKNRSFVLDLAIVARTIVTVISRTGR